MDGLHWRAMVPGDLDAVAALATTLFPDHHEDGERFAERLGANPSLCFALSDVAGAIHGYLVAYPWPLGRIPPLNRALPDRLPDPDALYLHDLGLHPAAAGRGHARSGLAALLARARGLGTRTIALVAVNASSAFWQSQGFDLVALDSAPAAKLESYGPDARYMVRELPETFPSG